MGRLDQAAWEDVIGGRRSVTWELWAEPISKSEVLTDEGKVVARWAVDRLYRLFGDAWLDRARQSPAMSWMWAPWNDVHHTFRRLIALGLRVAILEGADGRRRLRDFVRGNNDTWSHGLLQIEVAALAKRDRWEVEFEPRLASGKKGDVRVRRGATAFVVETTTLGVGREARGTIEFGDHALTSIQFLAARNDVSVRGELTGTLTRAAFDEWLQECARSVELVSRAGLNLVVDVPGGGQIEFVAGKPTPDERFVLSGPPIQEDDLSRLRRTIANKADQSSGDDPLWIRIDNGAMTWNLTPPVDEEIGRLHDHVTRQVAPIVDQCARLAGVVISSPPNYGYEGRTATTARVAQGRGHSIIRPLHDGFGRHTLLIANNEADPAPWSAWYESEEGWMSWALDYSGHPEPNRLFKGGVER